MTRSLFGYGCKKSIPRLKSLRHIILMTPPAPIQRLITIAQNLLDGVVTRDDLHARPSWARKAVAARLVAGLRLLRAYLRRLLILMALELEWGLVDKRGEMKPRPKRTAISSSRPSLTCLDTARPWNSKNGLADKPPPTPEPRRRRGAPVYIEMAKLYAQLNFLAKIVADPTPKAKRLAFHLARRRPYIPNGPILAPEPDRRIPARWGRELSFYYDAMGPSILTKSRNRPPPHQPRCTHWPTRTCL